MGSPLDRSATWPYEDGEPGRFSYARADHPTGSSREEALGALDGGRALLYPSGMGAVTTVVLTMLWPGGTIALAEGAYYGHRVLLDHLAPWGGRRRVRPDRPPPDGVDLILVEAPANPLLTMPDLDAAAATPHPSSATQRSRRRSGSGRSSTAATSSSTRPRRCSPGTTTSSRA